MASDPSKFQVKKSSVHPARFEAGKAAYPAPAVFTPPGREKFYLFAPVDAMPRFMPVCRFRINGYFPVPPLGAGYS
jgi:hypothetical protein